MLLAPKTDWIHPKVVIKLFANTVSEGISDISEFSDFVKSRDLKITTEAWRAAMYLVALSETFGFPHIYLQSNPKDPPDFYGLCLFERDGFVRGYEIEIEVFQVPNETPLSVLDEIEKKTKKAYSPKTVLVCHIRKSGFKATIGQLHDLVKKLNPTNEIWIIGGASTDDLSNELVAQIYPVLKVVKIDIGRILKENIENSFIRATRGLQEELKFEDLGKKRLAPNFTLHDFDE